MGCFAGALLATSFLLFGSLPLQEVPSWQAPRKARKKLSTCEPLLGISLVRFLLVASLLSCCCAASSNVREFPGVMGVLAYPIMIILFYSQVSESHFDEVKAQEK